MPEGMTTRRWERVRVRDVEISRLVWTQDTVRVAAVAAYLGGVGSSWSGDPYPHVVVRTRGGVETWEVEDGHTRVVAEALLGRATVKARVLWA